MAKATKQTTETKVRRQGRRVAPALRRSAKAAAPAAKAQVTLGDLIAAAFDTVGEETDKVAKLLASRQLRRATGQKIVLV